MDKKPMVIKCPYCGYEYLPREIYLPNWFFGKGNTVFRMEDGSIDCFEGDDMDLKETYRCDHCDKTFEVEADLSFKTTPIRSHTEGMFEVRLDD